MCDEYLYGFPQRNRLTNAQSTWPNENERRNSDIFGLAVEGGAGEDGQSLSKFNNIALAIVDGQYLAR